MKPKQAEEKIRLFSLISVKLIRPEIIKNMTGINTGFLSPIGKSDTNMKDTMPERRYISYSQFFSTLISLETTRSIMAAIINKSTRFKKSLLKADSLEAPA